MKVKQFLLSMGLEATEENINMAKEFLDGEISDATGGLKNKNSELLGKLKKFDKYTDLDIDSLLEQQKDNEVNDYIQHLKDGTAKEYIENLKASERQKVADEYAKAIAGKDEELTSWQDKFNSLQSKNDESLITETLRQQLAEAKGINKEHIDDIIVFARNQMEIEEVDGQRNAVYKNRGVKTKSGENSSINDWFVENSKPWMLAVKGGMGGAGGQSADIDLDLDEMDADDLADGFDI